MTDWPVDLAELATLDRHPSWCNNRGHVDRSACVELRASWVGRRVVDWRRARHSGGRREAGWAVIRDEDVEALMRRRFPRRLIGDYRTHARAMQPTDPRTQEIWDRRKRPIKDLGLRGEGPDRGCPANPNRGACRGKRLGLPGDWSQAICVERWLNHKVNVGDRWFRTPGQSSHKAFEICRGYVVCPGCGIGVGAGDGDGDAQSLARERPGSLGLLPCGPAQEVARIKALRLDERRRRHLSLVNPLYPNGASWCQPCRGPVTRRCMLLLMPLATAGELRDARLAQRWLMRRVSGSPGTVLECRLIERYGSLFGPRAFGCRHCLGVRYGSLNVKDLPAARRRWFGGRVMPWETRLDALAGEGK